MKKRSRRYVLKKKRNLKKSWKSLGKNDKSDLTRFAQVLGLTFVVIFALYYVGINGLIHIGEFWSIFTGKKDEALGDTVAPSPPTLAPLEPYTNSKRVSVGGFAEPGTEVELFINEETVGKVITEAGGTFTFSKVVLSKEGKNTLTATATDKTGNQSRKSAELIVTLDTRPPKLEISKPEGGQVFSGENKQIKVEGTSEPGVKVTVNDIQAQVRGDGSFSATIIASEPGQITITVVAVDKAGNEEKIELTVTYELSE